MSDDEGGSQLGIDLLINNKHVASVDGSHRSFNIGGRTDDDDDDEIDKKNGDIANGDTASLSSFASGSSGRRRRGGATRRKQHAPPSQASSSDIGSGSVDGSDDSLSPKRPNRPTRQEDILNAKRELLYQFTRLEKKGVRVPKHYTMTSDLDEMRADFDRLRRDVEVDASVRFQRRMLMACVSGIEFLNNRFDPFDVHLDGWSENVQDGINEYDDVFEELHEKYRGKMKMAPELRLLMTLGGSAVWFHMSHSMFRSTMPGIDQIFKQNPELKQQFMSATMKTMKQQQHQQHQHHAPNAPPQNAPPPHHGAGSVGGGLFGSLGNMMGGLFGGNGGNGAPPQQHQQRQPHTQRPPNGPSTPRASPRARPNMRGPSDVDDILSEINDERFSEMNDVLEIFSNGSSDSGGSSVGDDVVSIDDEPQRPRRRGGSKAPPRRRTLDLD